MRKSQRQQPKDAGQRVKRVAYIDWFRGILLVLMALGHASLFFNADDFSRELALQSPGPPASLANFLTRFVRIPVAPGFLFIAGFAAAIIVDARERKGQGERTITARLVVRGLVLLVADAVLTISGGYYSFAVLSCIGACLILISWLRRLPIGLLAGLGIAIMLLHPLLDVSSLPAWLAAGLYEPHREGFFRSLYPVIPWLGAMMLGFGLGRLSIRQSHPDRFWVWASVVSFLLFAVVRFNNGYGNAYPYISGDLLSFFMFAKYPPDLAWLTWAFGWVFALLAFLYRVESRSHSPKVLEPFAVYGRVSFFFYMLHYFVLGVAAYLVGKKFGLIEAYAIWGALMLGLYLPCRWYAGVKLHRPNWLTRYI